MAEQMFSWRVGAIPVDVSMVRPGTYRWQLHRAAAPHEARMYEKGNWSLYHGDQLVQIGLPSLRGCIARSFEVPMDVVKNISTG